VVADRRLGKDLDRRTPRVPESSEPTTSPLQRLVHLPRKVPDAVVGLQPKHVRARVDDGRPLSDTRNVDGHALHGQHQGRPYPRKRHSLRTFARRDW
jgi:hypothetical protein